MDHSYPSMYYEGGLAELYVGRDRLRIIGTALKDYRADGKSIEEFAEEYGCDIIYDDTGDGIQDVKFHNDSNETMFMLKYNNDV